MLDFGITEYNLDTLARLRRRATDIKFNTYTGCITFYQDDDIVIELCDSAAWVLMDYIDWFRCSANSDMPDMGFEEFQEWKREREMLTDDVWFVPPVVTR